MPKPPIFLLITSALAIGILIISILKENVTKPSQPNAEAREIVTTYRNIPIYSNGSDYTKSHGKHYADQGYYYGQKWQCVEFVKRFYYDAFNHQMPSVWGHAKDFYKIDIPHGSLNSERGMLQFENGGNMKPRPDDLLVFNSSAFGHVAVISAVHDDNIEVVQQNIAGSPRQIHPLIYKNGRYLIGSMRKPIGWLRLPTP